MNAEKIYESRYCRTQMFLFQSLEDLLESIRRMEDAADDPIDDKDKVTHTHTHTHTHIQMCT